MSVASRILRFLYLSVALLTLVHPVSAATVLDPGSTVEGKTIAEWTVDWWKWAFSFPTAENPLTDTTGEFANQGNNGPVFFVAGSIEDDNPATRSFAAPAGRHLLVPVINSIWITGPGETLQDGIDYLDNFIAGANNLHASLDGVPIPDVPSHQERSPVFQLVVPADNVFGFPAGTYDESLSDGFWLMLSPLPPGQHVLNFGGSSGDFTVEVTAAINAVPEPASTSLIALPLLALIARRRWTHRYKLI